MATTFEELGGIGTTTLLGAAVIASESSRLAQGALYSMGMELMTGYRNTPILNNAGGLYQIGSTYINADPRSLDFLSTQKNLPSNVLGLNQANAGMAANRQLTNVAAPGSALFPVINIGFTALTGMQRYSEGGGSELGRFLIEDSYAQFYGNKASELIGRVTESNRGAIQSAMSLQDAPAVGQRIETYRTILGSSLLGRALPVLGAYTGANLGFGIGQSIGEGLGGMLFDGSYGLGLAGGVMGARTGAMIGAAMTKSIPGLALSALAIGATSMATEAIGDILKTGFKNTRTRGLDFAGDLSAYNTNSAVTMRQRAVQSMHKSHLNARSALGQEASFQHMNRDYFAHYRRS